LQKMHIYELDYLRAVAMLGVLGIHTGAFAIGSPQVNIHLFLIFDILTRFSVPIFFFISAFGLFLNRNQKPFNYRDFLKRRINVVLIPYTVWSLIYLLHLSLSEGNPAVLTFRNISTALFYGLGSYHLYFLVILLWFYLLMPLWQSWLRIIVRQPLAWLTILYILQTGFNYYSVTMLNTATGSDWLDTALKYRLNYWVFHYLFIFLLGAVCAEFYESFTDLLTRYRHVIVITGIISLASMAAYYYHLIYDLQYTCEMTSSTLHQLHPLGIFYTFAMTLLLFFLFRQYIAPRHESALAVALQNLGANSYVIYLVHPLVMQYLAKLIDTNQYERSIPVILAFYGAAALFSYLISRVLYKGQLFFPCFRYLTGSSPLARPQPKQMNMNM